MRAKVQSNKMRVVYVLKKVNFNSIPHFIGFSFFCVFIQLLHHLKWQRGKLKTVKPYTTTYPTTTTTTARQNWTGGRKEVLKNFPTLPVSILVVWHFIENYFERKSKSISKINCLNTKSKIKLIIIQNNHAIQNSNWFLRSNTVPFGVLSNYGKP